MQLPKQNVCPFCHNEVVAIATWCGNCGRELPSEDPLEMPSQTVLYEIVPDGSMFGIALRGKIKIRGLEMESAQSIVKALNRR